MNNTSLTFAYRPRPADSGPEHTITLEPEYIDTRAAFANLADLSAMLTLARSGVSARHHQLERCRWARWSDDGALVVSLCVYVWPSSIDLAYTLTTPEQVTSAPPVLVQIRRHRKFWLSQATSLTLPWLLLDDADIHWHASTGCLDAHSAQIAAPALIRSGTRISLSYPVSGLISVTGTAIGWRHDLTIRFDKFDGSAGNAFGLGVTKYDADSFDVLAHWRGNDGSLREESAEMNIPQCVRGLLEACSDGTPITSLRVRHRSPPWYEVRYNTCDGSVLDVIRHDNDTDN